MRVPFDKTPDNVGVRQLSGADEDAIVWEEQVTT